MENYYYIDTTFILAYHMISKVQQGNSIRIVPLLIPLDINL